MRLVKAALALLPLGAFLVLVVFLASGMRRDPQLLPSTLIDRPAPDFSLEALDPPRTQTTQNIWSSQVVLVNVWASWCAACREEHGKLMALSRAGTVPIYGIAYKDHPSDARNLLARDGNPYVTTVLDPSGRTGIDYGVYGVPETLVIDQRGIVRYKHVGAIKDEVLQQSILPLIARLRSAKGGS